MLNRISYGSYLQLDQLLTLQQPVGGEAHGELFFIVAHQASELWLKSLLGELEAIAEGLTAGLAPAAGPMVHARRAVAAAQMLVAAVEALRALDADTFLRFRELLGPASGAQSLQFARLRRLVGQGQPDGGPIDAALRIAAHRPAAAPGVRDEWYWFLDSLRDLSTALWRWGLGHLDVTQRLIGARSGTGGTSGAHYLATRLLERPFPTLWRDDAGAGDGG